ncbi:hypothetical protein D210916BOD24_13890 [Alteromonas sp. D210916BOD_24]|uniref:hypothetical protein n=1 Tax=Alteromonas sp. D210916BOD_24 TaxID=3157618 RepID=UPI00399D415F
MSIINTIKLGLSTDLTKGYKSDWNPSTGNLNILYPSNEAPMQPKSLPVVTERGDWSYPIVSLHDTPMSLVTELLGYKVEHPAIDDSPPSLPAGALMLFSPAGDTARKALSETLGVSLDNPNLRYALVKLERKDAKVHHTTTETGILMTVNALNPDPSIGINSNFMRNLARLRHFPVFGEQDEVTQLKEKDANAYLDTFAEWGTHFVSSVTVGDQLIQVFAYEADRFERIKIAYTQPDNELSGSKAVDFQYFTTDASTGHFGYVSEYGKLLCLSHSSTFQNSLQSGEWMENFWSKHDSLFQVFAENSHVSLNKLNSNYTDQAPVMVTLGPMTTFTEYKRTAAWRRVLKGALSTVFGDTINAGFSHINKTDFNRLLTEEQPGLISTIASPTINVYKTHLDIAQMQLVARNQVKNFTTFGYVVAAQATTPIRVPGESVQLFGYILDMRAEGNPNVITLTDKGFDELVIGCDSFLGAARFQNTAGSKHMVVVDGLRYEQVPSGKVRVTGDVRMAPPADALEAFKDSLEFSLAFAEAVLGLQEGNSHDNPTQQLVRDYLGWVGRIIPADTTDEQLLAIRVHSLDLGGYSPNSRAGAFVPILPASAYKESLEAIMGYLQEIQRQISENTIQVNQRKQAELTIDVGKTLNQNIIQSGQLLTGLIKANADSTTDLGKQYDVVIAARKAESESQQAKISNLEKLLFEQQAEVDQAVQVYKSKVEQWETIELIKFGLDVVTSTFSLGTSILIPASSISAVKNLGLTAQRIQKTLNVLNTSMKLYSSISGTVQKLQNTQATLDGLDGMNFGDTSQLDWNEMSIQLDVVMSTGPSDASVTEAKAHMVAAFKILVMRGKALTSARSSLHQIQRDIYTTQRQKEINKRQADRLNALVDTLHPANIEDLDHSAIDLVGLTGNLDYLRRQMLTTFIKSFLLQDQALQYAWLQQPTVISSYSLLNFMQAHIAQTQATIEAKNQLMQYQSSTTNPIIYQIDGVMNEDISGGHSFEITIGPDSTEFSQYVNLRVKSVVAEIDGVKDTDSGKFLVRLTFEDSPFVDRNIERQPLTFHTPWRERIYQYNAQTNKPEFTDNGHSWSQGVSLITPFGAWRVDLPKTNLNKGIRFKRHTVKVRLQFTLEARIVDKPIQVAANTFARGRAFDVETLRLNAMNLAVSGAVQPSSTALIAQMNAQGTTTNGWDVVFNMGLSQINNSLRDQYIELKNNTTFKNTIDAETRTPVVDGVWSIKKFHMEYGYPLLRFSTNNDNTVELSMPIEKGSLTKCVQMGDEPERCDPPTSIAGKTLTAYVKLAKTSGKVQVDGADHNVLKVELNMKQGAFSVEDIEIDDEDRIALNKAIKAYFSENPVNYLINQLDISNVPVIDALKPNGFLFKALKTQADVEMLQMFIQTSNRALLNPTQTFLNGVSEPLPQSQDTSLIIRSALYYGAVLPQSMNRRGWTLVGKHASDPTQASWAEFTNAPVSATGIDLSGLTQKIPYITPYGGGSTTIIKYSFPNDTATWNLSGMTLKSTSSGSMSLNGSKMQSMTINTSTTTEPCYSDYCKAERKGSFSNDATSNVKTSAFISVSGSGRNQAIKIAINSQGVTVTGHLAGGGPSGSDDLQAKVNQQVKSQVAPKVEEQLNVSFDSVSLFAIKNLLFPSNNYINFSEAAVPGDLLILGTFAKDS